MKWIEKGTSKSGKTLYKENLYGIELHLDNVTYDIDICGKFSLKKRRVISPSSIKEKYKLIIENVDSIAVYFAVTSAPLNSEYFYIYPVVKAGGLLFKQAKKIHINKKFNRVEINFDDKGQIL